MTKGMYTLCHLSVVCHLSYHIKLYTHIYTTWSSELQSTSLSVPRIHESHYGLPSKGESILARRFENGIGTSLSLPELDGVGVRIHILRLDNQHTLLFEIEYPISFPNTHWFFKSIFNMSGH